MNFYKVWDGSTVWLMTLSLPTLPWLKPFLPLLGMPSLLLENEALCEIIYISAAEEYEKRWSMEDWAVGKRWGLGLLMQSVVRRAFEQFEEKLGGEVTLAWEHWILFHIFDHEAEMALHSWKHAFIDAWNLLESRGGKNKIMPPEFLIPLLPEIRALIWEQARRVSDEIEAAAPPPPYEQIPYEKMDKCYESLLAREAVEREIAWKVLRMLKQELNLAQQQRLVEWAQDRLRVYPYLRESRAQNLCGSKYLCGEFTDLNYPSIWSLQPDISLD